LALALFSFAVLVRILLKVWPGQYGFTLIVPGLAAYYWFFLVQLPSFFKDPMVRLFVKGGFLCVSLFFLFSNLSTEKDWYSKSTFPVASPYGTLRFFPAEPALSCAKMLDFLRQDSEVGDTLAVFPEGAALNFLSGLPDPATRSFCNPMDLALEGAQGRVIEGLEKNKVTYVALVQRDMSEYGASAFGRDYGKDIMGYVFQHYSSVQQFGTFPYTTPYFGIALFKRRSDTVILK
jgi:hypothetical protein